MTKKFLSIALAVIMLVSCVPFAFAAESGATITFTDSAIRSTSTDGVKISGTALTIQKEGTYILTGSCSNGSIKIKKGVTGVTLILSDLTLTASATAAITCNKGSGVSIVAAAGTTNTLADDKYNNDDLYTDETLYPDIENAVIKCKDGSNVTIEGTGTLNIKSYGKNGIKGGFDLYEDDADGNATDTLLSTASLTIKDLTLNISASVGDGLKSDKELNILSGNITVSAADDGIKSDYNLTIGAEGTSGPTIVITKSNEGIEGATINVYSGSIKVNASNDGVNAANSDLSGYSFSYNQYGGYVYINCTGGDGLDSNGTIDLCGGTLEVFGPSSGDGEPIDSDSSVNFAGANVLAVGQNMMNQGYSSSGTAFVTFGGKGGGFSSGSSIISANSSISIKDSSGNMIYTSMSKSPRIGSYVVFSSPSLENGSSYTLISGSASTGTSAATTSSSGIQGGAPGANSGFPGQGANSSNGGSSFFTAIADLFRKIINFFRSMLGIN